MKFIPIGLLTISYSFLCADALYVSIAELGSLTGQSPSNGIILSYDTVQGSSQQITTMPGNSIAAVLAVSGTNGCASSSFPMGTSLTDDVFTFNTQNIGASPTQIFSTSPVLFDLALSGTTAFAANIDFMAGSSSILKFDTTSSNLPTTVYTLPPQSLASSIAIADGMGYVSIVDLMNQETTISTFDPNNTPLTLTQICSAPEILANLSVSENYGIITTSIFLDTAGTPQPKTYSFDPTGSSSLITPLFTLPSSNEAITGSALNGSTAYIASNDPLTNVSSIYQYDLTSSNPPTILTTYPNLVLDIAINSSSGGRRGGGGGITSISTLACAINAAYESQQYISKGLADHLSSLRHLRSLSNSSQQPIAQLDLIADSSDTQINGCSPCYSQPPFSLWIDGIFAYFKQKQDGSTPEFHSTLGGAILGFDYDAGSVSCGTGIAYTYSVVKEALGSKARINQEYAYLYGAYSHPYFYTDLAIWGGYYQIDNKREVPSQGIASSHPKGWFLSPHLELGSSISKSFWTFEPFAMIDWPNSWEGKLTEKGSPGNNLFQDSQHSSLVRLETGMRFYETLWTKWGSISFLEKGSYVYKKPFSVGTTNAFLIGTPTSFTVDILTQTQNLGLVEFEVLFESKNNVYANLSYQGEFGSSFLSHQAMAIIGRRF